MEFNVKSKRLKIVEQIAIVLFFAVVIPITISGIIINNINQQSIRNQLKAAAELIANMVSDEIDVFQNTSSNELKQIVMTLDYFPTQAAKQAYLNNIIKHSKTYKKIFIVNSEAEFKKIYDDSLPKEEIALKEQLRDGRFLVVIFDISV